ncbi:MAG: 16S rRNA (cytosine(1402)-N(4))-methyltransferase RsmH [Synergistaceae bacterium]|jgi:16S rRNA (cytosine1402-N4)-methyltransferase|nr:16S rRNA (cytosine(1402)-N(4))-methyltransferase RsmH [Synergistaceae bacterium]
MLVNPEHVPVLADQAVSFLEAAGVPGNGKIVDCTLGLGGYSEKILRTFPQVQVYALDRDPAAVEIAEARLTGHGPRFRAFRANFGAMEEVLAEYAPLDAFVFDLGVSNMQLADGERGFSFQNDGPLDMRMDSSGAGITAANLLESLSAEELTEIFWLYGEERHSRRIAAGIAEHRRRKGPLKTTGELVGLIREILPAPVQRKMGGHPARRVFQALRIRVNDELGELEAGLLAAAGLVSPGAVVVVVSYHSLEDRVVKHTFRTWEREEKRGKALAKRPVLPSAEEIEANFKARSAKLRAFQFSDICELKQTRR